MSRYHRVGLLSAAAILALCFGFITGIFSQRHFLFGNHLKSLGVRNALIEIGVIGPWDRASKLAKSEQNSNLKPVGGHIQRPVIDCSSLKKSKLMTIITLGQSNAANYAPNGSVSTRNVYNFYMGKCYAAMDPLLGASGIYGSVWTKFADKVIEEGLYENLLIVSLAQGGSAVSDWIPGGKYYPMLISNLQRLQKQSFQVTHFFWHQGETDGIEKTPKAEYKKHLEMVINAFREQQVEAPFYVAIATRCPDINPEIQEAQAEMVNPEKNIYLGPNTDELGWFYRLPDECHFNAVGVNKHASMWFNLL